MIIVTVAFVIMTIGLTTILLWPLSILIHEIGHAIPMLLFSNKSVLICVWDREKSKKFLEFKINRLHFKLSIDSLFVSGFAQMSEDTNIAKWKNFIINLWGPLFSISICAFLFYASFYFNLHGFFKFLMVGFLIHSIIEIYMVFNYDIYLVKQYYQFSDGANLFHDIFKNFGSKEVNDSLYKYYSQEFAEASKLMKPIIEDGFDHFYFFHSYLISLCYSNSPSEAFQIYSSSPYKNVISPIEKSQFGTLLLIKGNEKGKELIIDAFQSDPKDDNILANKAFLSLLEGNYKNAIDIFSYLRSSESLNSCAHANLLLSKYKNKDENIELSHFDNCLLEFPLEAYAYRNKGIYLFEKENYKDALKCFRSALKLNTNCYEADFYFDKCLAKLNEKI